MVKKNNLITQSYLKSIGNIIQVQWCLEEEEEEEEEEED
jgi:hypothetical protein